MEDLENLSIDELLTKLVKGFSLFSDISTLSPNDEYLIYELIYVIDLKLCALHKNYYPGIKENIPSDFQTYLNRIEKIDREYLKEYHCTHPPKRIDKICFHWFCQITNFWENISKAYQQNYVPFIKFEETDILRIEKFVFWALKPKDAIIYINELINEFRKSLVFIPLDNDYSRPDLENWIEKLKEYALNLKDLINTNNEKDSEPEVNIDLKHSLLNSSIEEKFKILYRFFSLHLVEEEEEFIRKAKQKHEFKTKFRAYELGALLITLVDYQIFEKKYLEKFKFYYYGAEEFHLRDYDTLKENRSRKLEESKKSQIITNFISILKGSKK